MCGDYLKLDRANVQDGGSPLHVRGLQRGNDLRGKTVGITPACAGTTNQDLPACGRCGDHPCMCGDYHWTDCRGIFLSGSPLHVRGLLA